MSFLKTLSQRTFSSTFRTTQTKLWMNKSRTFQTKITNNFKFNQSNSKSTFVKPIATLGFFGWLWGSSVDYDSVRQDIINILDDLDHDDGSWGPILVRLAWHASGTYDKNDGSGGCNGATMRYEVEAHDDANAGLHLARNRLENLVNKHSGLTFADLWVLASYVAIEEMGGPRIEFKGGRKDKGSVQDCPPNGRLPDASQGAQHIRDVFYRMGFNDQEIVALVGGGHAIGRCHTDRSGFDGPWTRSPTTMSNQFFKLLLDEKWHVRNWSGPKQWQNDGQDLMMLPTDMALKIDPSFRKWVDVYYKDEERFLTDFGAAFKKLTEFGC